MNLKLTKLVSGEALGDTFAFVRLVPDLALQQVTNQNALPGKVVSDCKCVFVFVAFGGAEQEHSAC